MEINNFIRRARLAGRSNEQIREFLVDKGFDERQINNALGLQAAPQATRTQAPESLPRTIGLPQIQAQPTPVQTHEPNPQQEAYEPIDDLETIPSADLNEAYRAPTENFQSQLKAKLPQAASTAEPQPKLKKKRLPKIHLKKAPVLVAIAILVVGGGVGAYFLPKQGAAQSNNEAVDKFIKAMQTQNKEAADSLMSDTAKAFFQQKSGTPSAYESCVRSGSVCAPLFRADFLQKAQRTEKEYESGTGGGKGIETTFLLTKKHVPSATCKEESISLLTIAAVPNDGKWVIDKVTPQYDTSSVICPEAQ